MMDILIRLFFFVTYPALFSTAFTGVKMIVGQLAAASLLQWNPFVETLVILLVFTICFGRFFCGFACAFGTYGDFVYFLSASVRKRQKKKPFHVFNRISGFLRYLKYIVLVLILILVIQGNDTVVAMHSPFGTFSRLHALKSPESMVGLVLFILITTGMALESRFFCRFLCPMGAVFSLMPVLPVSVIKRDKDACIPNCRACKMVCPASLELPYTDEGDNHLSGECFACGKCVERCPKQNAGSASGKSGRLIMQIVKAAVLIGIFVFVYGL